MSIIRKTPKMTSRGTPSCSVFWGGYILLRRTLIKGTPSRLVKTQIVAGKTTAAEYSDENLLYRGIGVEIFCTFWALEMKNCESAIGREKEPVPSVVSKRGNILVASLPVGIVRDIQKYLSGGPDDVAHFERKIRFQSGFLEP
ncbi:hypothetical protein [uncultured Bilophila sp.]|uniref:hypothetical protein n=1 Tax=uncultured Bilophila sp. TaxID=529385 RepID=UPI00280B5061|nr:hypothetical protein [uncultured Bilophila sp.]